MKLFVSLIRDTLVVGLLSLSLMGSGCSPSNEYVPPPPPTVSVARPLQQTVTDYLEETGTTEAVQQALVQARVRGVLEEIRFEQGQDVQKGDVLYVIERQVYEAEVNRLQAAVEVAEARRLEADARYQRAIPLVDKQVMSREEGEERKAELAVAKANVVAAEAELAQAEIDLEYTTVVSPIDGRAGKTLVKLGNLVEPGTPLTTIVDYESIYANFNISERQLLELSSNKGDGESRRDIQSISIYLRRATDEGYPFEGKLDYADLAVDQSTGTFLVRGIIPNPNREIVPGLFVRVRLPIGVLRDALIVPRTAVGFDQEGRYLLAVDDRQKAERRDVRLGPELGDVQVVLDGLSPSDRVIIRGVQRAREGQSVTPEEVASPVLPPEAAAVESTDRNAGSSVPTDSAEPEVVLDAAKGPSPE